MDETKQQGGQGLTPTTVITLIIGVLSVSVTLFIFYSSRARPSLIIEQRPLITYASTKALSSLGQVKVSVNGEEIVDLLAVPFILRNTGNVPLSSVQNTPSFNMAHPISLEFNSNSTSTSKTRVYTIQAPTGPESPLTCSFENTDNCGTARIEVRTLNPGDEISFTVLLTGSGEPSVKLLANPLIGGTINFLSISKSESSESFWSKIKSFWLALTLGVILLSQFPIVFVWLIVEAKKLTKKQRQEKIREEIENDPAKKIAEAEQKKRIEEDLQNHLKVMDKNLVKRLKNLNVPIPKGMFEDSMVSTSAYDLFHDAFLDQWRRKLEEKFALPKHYSSYNGIDDYIFTNWYDWEDYWKGALFTGLISLIVGVLGYTLIFY